MVIIYFVKIIMVIVLSENQIIAIIVINIVIY